MICHPHAPEELAWLEIEGSGLSPRQVHCPRRGETKEVRECCGCTRFATLAIHPSGKHIYVVCEPFADRPEGGK
ncbi:hypothetical protein [Sorangium sp. So ce131]|uniref:hypothetical protein n=1 Tax=Sorangium sp. So ce131 TaxID=3133282 RepID=UPI003F60C126